MTRIPRRIAAGLATCCVLAGGLLFAAGPALAAPEAPVTLSPATSLTATSAVLEGVLNPHASATANAGWYFAYSTGLGCLGALTTPDEPEVVGHAVPVHALVSGLEPNKAYVFCLVATSLGEVSQGNEVSFVTLPAVPSVDGESVSSVSATEATLEAQVNPNNEQTTYAFEYASNKALVGAKTAAGVAALSGAGDQTASVVVGGLEPGMTYYYRVVARNATGEVKGAAPNPAFTSVPVSFTDAPVLGSGVSATFNGHFTLIPVDTKYSFDYKAGGECAGEDSTPTVDAGTGDSTVAEAWEVPSAVEPSLGWPAAPPLKPNTEYTVCFVLANAYGSQVGPGVHFTTAAEPPTIDSESVNGEGAAGMTLEARINPNVQETTYFFEYATSEAAIGTPQATKVVGDAPLVAELAELPVSVKIGVPQPATTYYYRVVGENESTIKEGTPADGAIQSFALPVVSTGEAQNVNRTTATLTGTVNPEGAETTYYFAYIDQAGYEKAEQGNAEEKADPYTAGEQTTLSSAGASTVPQTVPPTPATGLLPQTTYHYALVAKSNIGIEYSKDQTLTTPTATPPIVTTGGASNVGQTTATLSGTVDTNSLQTEYAFEIASTPGDYGPATGLGSIGGAQTETITQTLGELQPATTYYYRITATNADGTTHGTEQAFTTTALPNLFTIPPSAPLITLPPLTFPTETGPATSTPPKPLTTSQKLAKALKACKKDKKKHKRTACEKQAKKKYAAKKKKK